MKNERHIAVRGFILALAVVIGASWEFAAPTLAAEGKPAAADQAKDKKKDKDKDKAHAVSTSPSYLGMDPIYTTIIEGDDVRGMLMVGIGIDVPDEALRTNVERIMPSLRDLYVRSLIAFTATSVRPWRQPDVEDMLGRLQRVTDMKLGRKGARVLVAQVTIRLNK